MGLRPVSTYSIVAIDEKARQMGVAVQSHWFSVGSAVPWAEPGVGVVATQAFVEPSYGPLGLRLMRRGTSPKASLTSLLKRDSKPEVRQVAMLNAKGKVAAHTGSKCLPEAGDLQGEGYSAQANLMSSDEVWPEMAKAFSSSRGPLSERLLKTLEAAEAAGGDIRGRQSACILIVSASKPKNPWLGRVMDLRVEDHPAPLVELRRIVKIGNAYDHANRGDDLVTQDRFEEAMKEYSLAAEGAPGIEELRFWQGVTLLDRGRESEGIPLIRGAFKARREWRKVFERLPEYGLLHADAKLIQKVLRDT